MQILSNPPLVLYPAMQAKREQNEIRSVCAATCGLMLGGAARSGACCQVYVCRVEQYVQECWRRSERAAHFPARLLPIWRKKSMTFLLLPELPLFPPVLS